MPDDSATEQLAALGQALAARQVLPWFQPKVALHSGQLKGVEALARWQHPQRGLLDADDFIGGLEQAPLLAELTLQMLEQVLRHLHDWRLAGLPPLAVSLNLPAAGLADRALIDRLARAVQAAGVAPVALLWEVGEADLARWMRPRNATANVQASAQAQAQAQTQTQAQAPAALANMGRLRLMGFGLALDDFGAGALSLRHFACCPFTELKIDRGRAAAGDARLDEALALARQLGVATVAEGVETQQDWQRMRAMGCDMAQGHLLARPMPAGELVGWMRSDRRRLKALALGDM